MDFLSVLTFCKRILTDCEMSLDSGNSALQGWGSQGLGCVRVRVRTEGEGDGDRCYFCVSWILTLVAYLPKIQEGCLETADCCWGQMQFFRKVRPSLWTQNMFQMLSKIFVSRVVIMKLEFQFITQTSFGLCYNFTFKTLKFEWYFFVQEMKLCFRCGFWL